MLKWVILSCLGLITVIGATVFIGMLLPKAHAVSRTVAYRASPRDIFALISDFENLPQWRTGVTKVEIVSRDGTNITFREFGGDRAILYRVETHEPHSRLVTRIADPSLPFGGTWTFELKPGAGSTELTITENGEVYNPFFRFMSKFVFSHYSTMDTYLRDLGKRLDQTGQLSS